MEETGTPDLSPDLNEEAGPGLEDLPADLLRIVMICSLSSSLATLGRLRSLNQGLKAVGASPSVEAAACQKLRKDVKQHINDRGRSEQEQPHLRVCAASELLRRLDPDGVEPTNTTMEAVKEVLLREHRPEVDHDVHVAEDEEDVMLFNGVGQLVYGYKTTFAELKKVIYVGRRWYSPANSEKDTKPSQSLSEKPYEGQEHYTEIHCETDLSELWLGNSPGIAYPCAGPRPAGVKAFNGPFLKYHLPDALNDLLKRAGLAHFDVDIHCTGFMDEAGPEIVIGVFLGCLDSCSFDLFHAIGVRFCKPEDAQGHGIVDVTPDFLADLDGHAEKQVRVHKLLKSVHDQLSSLQTLLPEVFDEDDLNLRLVFNADC